MAVSPVSRRALSTSAAGVQFKVLGQVFPVLRHEVIRPISNAALAAAMLRQAPEHAGADATARQDDLAADLESMLAESTAEIRRLTDWLEDSGETVTLPDLLEQCRKLVFTQMLRSGKQIRLPEHCPAVVLPAFSGRYVVLAWLLCLLDTLPEGAELRVEARDAQVLQAHRTVVRPDTPAHGYVSVDEFLSLSAGHGWIAECDSAVWTLQFPAEETDGA